MSSAKDTGDKRAEIVAVAAAMIDSKMNLIEGVRKITALRHDVGNPDDEILMPIRAIESETDHFPIGPARVHCAPEYLAGADAEMQRYLADAKDDGSTLPPHYGVDIPGAPTVHHTYPSGIDPRLNR